MTFSSKMFWFAEKIGLFSMIGSVMYPLVSLLVFVPIVLSLAEFHRLNSSFTTVIIMIDCTNGVIMLQMLLSGWQSKKIFSTFISQIPLRRMPNPRNMIIMLISILTIDVCWIFNSIMQVLLQSEYLAIPVVIGVPLLVFLSFINLLVIGSPCTLLSKFASDIINKEESDVTELVLCYKMFQESVSAYLFVIYSLTTVQLILILYTFAINFTCFTTPVIWSILQTANIVGLCNLLFFIALSMEKTFNIVQEVANVLRQELSTAETKDRRHKLKSLIHDVETCEPFTAFGFYTVDKSTLTATLGTILTYLIILFQTVTC